MPTSKTDLKLTWYDEPPGPFSGQVAFARNRTQQLAAGTGDNQHSSVYARDSDDDGTIAGAGTVSVDLKTAEDRFGVALNAVDVVELYVEHKAESLASSIHVAPNGVNGWTALLNGLGTATLKPGDTLHVTARKAGSAPVTGSNKVLDIVNDDATDAAQYVFGVLIRR